MATRNVNTTIPVEDHQRGLLNNISWTKALSIGIEVLCGDFYNEEKELQKEINQTEGKLKLYKKRLEKLKKARLEKKTKDPKLKEKIRMAQGLKANNPLRYSD